jgi:hypothetical protein
MSQLLSAVIPLSLGAMVSPTVLGAIVLTLSGKVAPGARAWMGIAGMVAALVLVTIAFWFLGRYMAAHRPDPRVLSASDALAGVVLLALGVRGLMRLHAPQTHAKARAHAASARRNLLLYFGLGFVLIATDVTSIVLYIPAMKDVVTASANDPALFAVAVIPFFAVLAPALAPATMATAAPGLTARVLTPLNVWVTANSRLIGVVICFGFGVWLVAKGSMGLLH